MTTEAVQTPEYPSGALDDVVVLDFTHVLAGPFCTMVLGDLGADVIKVERLDGDETRRSSFRINDFSEQFAIVNRNKKSVAVDLSTERGRQLIRDVVPKVDVIVENFRPGTMARLGLDYDSLRELNPRLIYCAISAFGATGSESHRGGFDIVAQAMSGVMSVTGSRDGDVVKVGIPVSDLSAGLYATTLISAALHRRAATGEGENIDVSLVHSAMSLLVWEAAQMWSKGVVPGPMGTAHRNRTPYQAFPASDGMFIVGAGNEATWQALCRALDRDDLAADPRFVTNPERMRHEQQLVATLEKIFVEHPIRHWIDLLTEHGCPVAPILSVAEAFQSQHAAEHHMIVEVENPAGGSLPTVGFPYVMSAHPPRVRRRPPRLGEHTRAVLRDLGGLDDDRIDSLSADAVVAES